MGKYTQFPPFSCFTVSSWDIQRDIKARGLPLQIPPAWRPGTRLISQKIHPLLSQKVGPRMKGSTDERKYVQYLLCQFNLSAGRLALVVQPVHPGKPNSW